MRMKKRMERIVIWMERIVKIEGMHCMHCAGAVKKALEALGLEADVRLEEKLAVVKGDAADADITDAVAKKGFSVVSVEKA